MKTLELGEAYLVEYESGKTEVIIVGCVPEPNLEESEMDESVHNCDEMGCPTFPHVIGRLEPTEQLLRYKKYVGPAQGELMQRGE